MKLPDDYRAFCRGVKPGDTFQVTVNGVTLYVLLRAKGKGSGPDARLRRVLFLAPEAVRIDRVNIPDGQWIDGGPCQGGRPVPFSQVSSVAIHRTRVAQRREPAPSRGAAPLPPALPARKARRPGRMGYGTGA